MVAGRLPWVSLISFHESNSILSATIEVCGFEIDKIEKTHLFTSKENLKSFVCDDALL